MKSSFYLKSIVATVLFTLASTVFAGEPKPKYGPQGKPYATTLSASHEYLANARNHAPDYWALAGYYVPQINGYSCSAASVSMVLNAARTALPKTADDMLVTQQNLLDKVDAEHWKLRLSKEGFEGHHGTSLLTLAKVVEAAFKSYGFPQVQVRAVAVAEKSAAIKAQLRKDLTENEKSANDFIIANFNQKAFTDDADAGHIAPVGAYDAARHRVLVFDPDRDYYEPYWVSEETFLDGLATKDSEGKTPRGYLVVKLK